jgi:hypothetical protein
MKTISKIEALELYGVDIDNLVKINKASVSDPLRGPRDEPDDDKVSSKLRAMVDALIVAGSFPDRQTATHYLLHDAHGRRLAEHLNSIGKTEKEITMPQVNIMKLHNIDSVTEVAKNVIDDKVALTEHQFTEILTGHARLAKRTGESTMAAFERILTDPENADIRKAYTLTKGYQPAG